MLYYFLAIHFVFPRLLRLALPLIFVDKTVADSMDLYRIFLDSLNELSLDGRESRRQSAAVLKVSLNFGTPASNVLDVRNW